MHLLQKFLPGKTFAPIVTRDFRPPKPDPAGILHIARDWELDDGGEGLIMVPDTHAQDQTLWLGQLTKARLATQWTI
jgi:phosphoglycolate phosphatase-like HAD superfamily hydrolase